MTFEHWSKRSVRWYAWLALAGLVMVFVAVLHGRRGIVGMQVIFAAGVLFAAQPAGFAISAGLRDPSILSDRIRVGAALGGIGAIGLAVRVFPDPGVAKAWLLAGLLLVIGLIALANVMRSPRPASWWPPLSVLAGAALAIVFSHLPYMLDGTKPYAHYDQMRVAAEEIRDVETGAKADSGHYVTHVLEAAGSARERIELTADGYRAWTTSASLEPQYTCAVYAGSQPAAPATEPGVVACVPYPNEAHELLAVGALAGVVLTGFIGLGIRRSA